MAICPIYWTSRQADGALPHGAEDSVGLQTTRDQYQMFRTYRRPTRGCGALRFTVRITTRALTFTTLSDAITQLRPQTRLAMSLLWIVLFADWVPSLFVPIQLMPAPFASALISALNTSLGVCSRPFVDGAAMSILIGSLAAGSLNATPPPGGSVKLSRSWSGPLTMSERLLVAA